MMTGERPHGIPHCSYGPAALSLTSAWQRGRVVIGEWCRTVIKLINSLLGGQGRIPSLSHDSVERRRGGKNEGFPERRGVGGIGGEHAASLAGIALEVGMGGEKETRSWSAGVSGY